MKIIITEYFEKHFNKIVSDLSMENLIWNLHKDKILEWRNNNWKNIEEWKYYTKIINI